MSTETKHKTGLPNRVLVAVGAALLAAGIAGIFWGVNARLDGVMAGAGVGFMLIGVRGCSKSARSAT
jgi:hypothetical protein